MRRLLRMTLPLTIFIILILISCGIGYAIINFSLAQHARGEYFQLKNNYVEIEFPRNWLAFTWEEVNATGGRYVILCGPTDLRVAIYFMTFDELATQTYMDENNITDAFSAITLEVSRIYNWSLGQNPDAKLHFTENGTITLANHEANYTIINIEGGYVENEAVYNWTGMITSWIDPRMTQIVFYGEENDWNQVYNTFRYMLNSTKT